MTEIPRELLNEKSDELAEAIKECDVVVHLATAHPGNTEAEAVYDTNVNLAYKLLAGCDKAGVTPYIIYASSTHIRNDNPYGKAKKEVGEALRKWGSEHSSPVTNLVIPNEFGEGGKPFSTSVVSTFCHQLVNGEESDVNPDAKISLIHAQDIARAISDLIGDPKNEDIELEGKEMAVSDVYKLLSRFKDDYYNDVIPSVESPLETALFNTLHSHIFASGFYPRAYTVHEDNRGILFEMVKQKTHGQTFISTTKPGSVRGGHYHTRKIERFCVIQGDAEINVRDILSDETISFKVSGGTPVYIDMPTFFAHNIVNKSEADFIGAFWSNELFDPKDPDTYAVEV